MTPPAVVERLSRDCPLTVGSRRVTLGRCGVSRQEVDHVDCCAKPSRYPLRSPQLALLVRRRPSGRESGACVPFCDVPFRSHAGEHALAWSRVHETRRRR
jgi:hypothetical protein